MANFPLMSWQDNRAGVTMPYDAATAALEAATLSPLLPEAQRDIAWALGTLNARRPMYTEFQRYYAGDHRLAFATDGYREQFAVMLKRLNANLSPAVVSAITDRLVLSSFEEHTGSTGADSDDEVAAERSESAEAWAYWEDEALDLVAAEVHDEALINGDGYVIVWPDEEGRATVYANDATEVTVRYNVERKDRIDVAAKLWHDADRRWRLTLYYPDRVEKYRTRLADRSTVPPVSHVAFAPFTGEGDPGWPVENPYGRTPVFHFPSGGQVGGFGISELRDVLPIQDALNKALADTLVAQEFGAYVQRWATGIERRQRWDAERQQMVPEEDDAQLGIRRILTATSDSARFGQFTPTDLDKFVSLINAHFSIVGKIKGIPPHYFYMVTGDFPSGEAQRTAESRLVSRVKRLQRRFGAIWAEVVAFALVIGGIGDGKPSYRAQWETAEARGDQEQVQNYKAAIDAGMPPRVAAKRFLNMPEEEIETMMAEKDESDRAAAANAQEAFTRVMDAGRVPPRVPNRSR